MKDKNFNLIFTESWKSLEPMMKKLAEYTPKCSDLTMRIDCELDSAREHVALLLILPLLTPSRNYFSIELLTEKIKRKAFKYHYEGEWKVVGELLQLDPFSIYDRWMLVLNDCSTNDWFGNILPLMVKVTKRIKYKKHYAFPSESSRPVRKPQRKRGYSDKGTPPKPSHKWLPTPDQDLREKRKVKPIRRIRDHEWFGRRRGRG